MGGDHLRMFESATAFVQSAPPGSEVDPSHKLKLYALYKQATVGPCNCSRPNFFDFTGRAKWDSWAALGSLSSNDAQQQYVGLVGSLWPGWELHQPGADEESAGAEKAANGSSPGKRKPHQGMMGPVVSKMVDCGGEMSPTGETDIYDWIKNGQADKVSHWLDKGEAVDQRDENGMAALHWACDRGHLDIARLLLTAGADVNVRDGTGQTPLHYAASCDHLDVIGLLVTNGADIKMVDDDGFQPIDNVQSNEAKALLGQPC